MARLSGGLLLFFILCSGLAAIPDWKAEKMPELRTWMEVHGNGPGERVLRFRTVDRGPVYKKCYTVSVDGAFNIALTPEGRRHIGYYADESQTAIQAAASQAVAQMVAGPYANYCEINGEPVGCLKTGGTGHDEITIDGHPLGGAHVVQAHARIYIGETFSPSDERCDPESEIDENQYPRLEVQVTAPTYPGVDFRPILEFYRAQTFPVIPDFDLQTAAQNAIDAALALPRESLVVIPAYAEWVIFNTEEIPGGTPGLSIYINADAEGTGISIAIANPESTATVASCNTSYEYHTGPYGGAFVPGQDVELKSRVSQVVYAPSGAYPVTFMPDDFLVPYRDGGEEVGFKEVFELIPTGDDNWEMKPSTGLVPNPTSYYYNLWTDDDGNPQMWTSRSLPAYSAMSGVMSLTLDFKSHETIDPGDNPKCRLNLFYKRKEPINDQCEIQWFSWFEHPETVVSPGMQVACRVPYRNKPPEPDESA